MACNTVMRMRKNVSGSRRHSVGEFDVVRNIPTMTPWLLVGYLELFLLAPSVSQIKACTGNLYVGIDNLDT